MLNFSSTCFPQKMSRTSGVMGSSQWLGLMNSSWIAAHKITTLAEKTKICVKFSNSLIGVQSPWLMNLMNSHASCKLIKPPTPAGPLIKSYFLGLHPWKFLLSNPTRFDQVDVWNLPIYPPCVIKRGLKIPHLLRGFFPCRNLWGSFQPFLMTPEGGHNTSNRNPFLLIKSDKPSICFPYVPY